MMIWNLLKRHPKSRIGFIAAAFLPPSLALTAFVILPVLKESGLFTTAKGYETTPRIEVRGNEKDRPNVETLAEKNAKLILEEKRLKMMQQMAVLDSFSLVLDLKDSSAVLMNHGVPIRESKILSMQISTAFKILHRKHFLDAWLDKPFISRSEWSTIPKEPMQIRYAPKDTIEAGIYAQEPVNLDTADVYYRIQFDRNLILNVAQAERPRLEGWVKRFIHDLKVRWEQTGWKSGFMKQREIPNNPFQIDLKLSQTDAKAIYRALPRRRAWLVIRKLPEGAS
jgi:hypothetical protein